MFKVRIVQAEFGDCFLLEYGNSTDRRFLLIDGGPPTTFERHLESELESITSAGGHLDLIMLSHVDNDHIVGLLDLMARLRGDSANGSSPLIATNGLWHNSFSKTIDVDNTLEPRLRAAAANAAAVSIQSTVNGIGEGNDLRLNASALGIPINQGFPKDLVCVDDNPTPVTLGNLTLTIVGPTRANLDELQRDWEEWVENHEEAVATGDPFVMANSDRSIPNLSSIMVLAEADGKRMLCTGDGRSDHLLKGLLQANLLDGDGALHVDLLKVAHHGSDRNATRKFFQKITADAYLVSANGKDGNPDTATLIWIVEEAKGSGREIEIVITNETPSTKKLVEEYDPADYGYRLKQMPKEAHAMTLTLAE
jgi:Metallo-beta-lactamase superfamily